MNGRDPPAGEDHPGAVLSDNEVALLLQLREAGLSFGAVALKLGVSKSCAFKLVKGQRRLHAHDLPDAALAPRRRCTAPLPALPALVDGQDAGLRAMALMAHALAPRNEPST